MDFSLGWFANERANAGSNLNEPLTLKLLERFADRGAAHLEFLGQCGLG